MTPGTQLPTLAVWQNPAGEIQVAAAPSTEMVEDVIIRLLLAYPSLRDWLAGAIERAARLAAERPTPFCAGGSHVPQ